MSRYKEGDLVRMISNDCGLPMVVTRSIWNLEYREMHYEVYRDGKTYTLSENWLARVT
jgi:hypothetical protein